MRRRGTSRSKNKAEDNQDSILLGRSLPDSDIRLKWERARKEAKSALAFGKRIELTIHGNEEEVETMKAVWLDEKVRKLWIDDEFEFGCVEVVRKSRVLLTVWDSNYFVKTTVLRNKKLPIDHQYLESEGCENQLS
ncbi:hypothetical protein GQ457_09G019740 [Hibiscus cannabinus]